MKGKRKSVEAFVSQIENLKFENAFNPYTEVCPTWDGQNSPEVRRQNLKNVFRAALNNGIDSVWIGRDLGYRGGRRTGLALTDDVHLHSHRKLLRCAPLRRATKGPALAERTAFVVWQMLQAINRPIFLWNVFPLHPHTPADPFSNRAHSKAEAAACRPILVNLLNQLNPRRVVAIGRDAQAALENLGITSIGVRHPSYGGQNEFVSGLSALYELQRPHETPPHQADLF